MHVPFEASVRLRILGRQVRGDPLEIIVSLRQSCSRSELAQYLHRAKSPRGIHKWICRHGEVCVHIRRRGCDRLTQISKSLLHDTNNSVYIPVERELLAQSIGLAAKAPLP